MPTPKRTRILDADAYDTLEFGALATRGIGRAAYWLHTGRDGHFTKTPCCAHGYGLDGGRIDDFNRALTDAGITEGVNDDAVEAINKRRGRDRNARVPFALWCNELGVVRGPHKTGGLDWAWTQHEAELLAMELDQAAERAEWAK